MLVYSAFDRIVADRYIGAGTTKRGSLMKKIAGNVLICLTALCVSMLLWTDAGFAGSQKAAPETGQTVYAELEGETASTDNPANNDELFGKYVESKLFPPVKKRASAGQGARLEGLDRAIYNKLKSEIILVANGEKTSTAFEISVDELGFEKTEWTAEELGVEAIIEDGDFSPEAVEAISAMLDFDLYAIMQALLADCPYELYWYDKVSGMAIDPPGIYAGYNGQEYVAGLSGELTVYFAVAQGYSAGEYEVNTENAERVQSAVSRASEIVAENSAAPDHKKLASYKDAICGMVAYDYDAANDDMTPYGDSWQIISVFDGDDDTNVVCEGYAKAFQYLCELTYFNDDISCISVSGDMYGGTGAGPHMWNIVNMEDGKSYLVDVTNCDEGTLGEPDQLFLTGPTGGDVESGYTFTCTGGNISYIYDPDTLNSYSYEELELSEAYVPGHKHHFTVDSEKAPGCTEAGWVRYICDDCGESYTEEIGALGHAWGEWTVTSAATCTSDGIKERACSRCGDKETEAIPALGHDWGEWATTKEATCTADGVKKRACSRCEEKETEVIKATGHRYGDWVTTKEATCTENGTREKVCAFCGDKVTEEIPALDHDWGEWMTTKAATCTADGVKERACSRCDQKETETIGALGHVWNTAYTADKAATCAEDGIESIHCSVCDTVREGSERTIPATGIHNYGDWVTVEPPTYDAAGVREHSCTVCGHTEQEDIPMLERTSITGATVSGIKAKVYTGKALTQAPTVKLGGRTLKNGTDYKLTYSKNTKVGTATVTINGINAYKGSISRTFKINPKATSLTSVKPASKGFTAKWAKKTTQTTGYQLQYSTSSTFKSGNKTVTIAKNSTVSKKITKLKAKKKYYVRVRTYMTVNGTKYYSAWSAKKAVTTKK